MTSSEEVIRARFALDQTDHHLNGGGKTLQQVGEMIGVTKERVRQIQNKALGKLRTASGASHSARLSPGGHTFPVWKPAHTLLTAGPPPSPRGMLGSARRCRSACRSGLPFDPCRVGAYHPL